jgi:centromere-localized protein 2
MAFGSLFTMYLTRKQLQESTSTKSHSEMHTKESILPEMEDACEDLDEEIIAMEKEAAAFLEDIRTTVGDLSDLRYGRFSRVPGVGDDLGKETLEGLKRLEQVCNDIGSRSSGVLEV